MARPTLWTRFKQSFFSPEAALKRRNALKRDLARSPVGDMKAVLKCEGKFFPTPSNLSSPHESPQLPHWLDTAIDGSRFSLREHCRRRPLLLALSLSAYSEPQVDTFRTPFLEKHAKDADIVEIYPLMSRFKWVFFSAMLRRFLRNSVDPARKSSMIVNYRPMELLDALNVPNYYGGYVYLLDWEGRMRWQACGAASEVDLAKMHNATAVLIQEYKKQSHNTIN